MDFSNSHMNLWAINIAVYYNFINHTSQNRMPLCKNNCKKALYSIYYIRPVGYPSQVELHGFADRYHYNIT